MLKLRPASLRGFLSPLAVGLSISGCVTYVPVRASSLAADDPGASRARFQHPRADIGPAVEVLFKQRGFPLVNKMEVSPLITYYIFKGPRQAVTSVRGNADIVVSETYNIGSWFVARLAENGTGTSTEVFLLGKPTVNGTEVCSDADVILKEAQYWCVDTKLKQGAPEAPLMTGREETEAVKGILIELSERVR